MNIFYLDRNPKQAAEWMIDKHIVKMPTESAQMLSTAHRYLDGEPKNFEFTDESGKTKSKKMLLLPDETLTVKEVKFDGLTKLRPGYVHPRGFALYAVAHLNHPSTKWSTSGRLQYMWHLELTKAMLIEYTRRYGKRHGVETIMDLLSVAPNNISDIEWTEPTLAMPDEYKSNDHIQAYRNFYVGEKYSFASWKNTQTPNWFKLD